MEVDLNDSLSLLESLMTSKEAAKLMKISTGYLSLLASQGKIKFYKVGKARKFLRVDLEAYLAACAVEASKPPAPTMRARGPVKDVALRHLKPQA